MKYLSVLLLLLTACASWHWEKAGGNYAQDEKFCKQQTYTGTDGMVTKEMVRRMHGCMEAKGWRKVAN